MKLVGELHFHAQRLGALLCWPRQLPCRQNGLGVEGLLFPEGVDLDVRDFYDFENAFTTDKPYLKISGRAK